MARRKAPRIPDALLDQLLAGADPKRDCQEFRVGRPVEHQAAMALVKRSPKRTAN